MLYTKPSQKHIKRMNTRQRKKVRVSEFQELAFSIEMEFAQPMDEAEVDTFIGDLLEVTDARKLAIAGLGGVLPLKQTIVYVAGWDRLSPTQEDRQAVLEWIKAHPSVSSATASEFEDAWYAQAL